jgi:hypothetical protein
MSEFNKMENIAEGISDFGDLKLFCLGLLMAVILCGLYL